MLKRRKPIELSPAEDHKMRRQYKQWRIPRGQYKKHPDYLAEFTNLWNNLSGRTDSPIEVLHYIESQQKHKDRLEVPWPTFDGAHKRLEPVASVINADRAKAIRAIYVLHILPLDIGTDGLCYNQELVDLLENEFFKRTKIRVPGMLLAAWIENERKQGRWFTLRDDGGGLSGLDAVGG